MKLNQEQLTAPAHEIKNLNDLIFLSTFQQGLVKEVFKFMLGQVDGQEVGLLKSSKLLGKTAGRCGSDYGDNAIDISPKQWDIKRWEIKEKLCYNNFEGTIADYALRKGVNVGDLTGTDIMTAIVEPLMKEEVAKTVFRLALFGDKDITSAAIKGDATVENFNTIDGVWKQIFVGNTAGKITRTNVDANTKTTIAAQKTAINTNGVASKLIDDFLADAPVTLDQATNKKIILTSGLWKAWLADVKRNNKGSEGQWNSIFGGITTGEINGIKAIVVPFMDEIIQEYQVNETNSGAYNMPYRAILTTEENLLLGTNNDTLSLNTFDVFYDKRDDFTYVKAMDTIGALVLDERYIHVAF